MKAADLVLYLFDVQEMNAITLQDVVNDFEQQGIRFLLVGNKVDTAASSFEQFSTFANCIFISAKDQYNIHLLKEALVQAAVDGSIDTEATIVTNARHYDALQKLFVAIQDVQDGLNNHIQSDLLALDIRQALHYLGEITGEITNEDQLDFIFSKFCIGK
jgi:tRNA modification GTPase